MHKATKGVIISIACLACLLVVYAVYALSDSFLARYPVQRHIRYTFTLQNSTNKVIKAAEFWTYAPVKQTATQRCGRLVSTHPYDLIVDAVGNQALKFTFAEIAPFETKIVAIDADIDLAQKENHISLRQKSACTEPERYIESDNPEIHHKAEDLRGLRTLSTAKNIFGWVSDNVRYKGYVPNERGAAYAFTYKEGDCTESADLFAALCRANKIPARTIGGYICTTNTILKPGEYHNWAEFYDGSWHIVDPQNKIFMQNSADYIAMRIIMRSETKTIPDFDRYYVKAFGLQARMN